MKKTGKGSWSAQWVLRLANLYDMATEEREPRPLTNLPVDDLIAANDLFQELVAERVPRSFPVELTWELIATAFLARIASILNTITLLIQHDRQLEGEVTLRTLYETTTVFCWLAIDPKANITEWRRHSDWRLQQLHDEVSKYGGAAVADDELDLLDPARGGSLEKRADAVDAFWPLHSTAFRPVGPEDEPSVLTFRGFYTTIFRPASRVAHAEADGIDGHLTARPREVVVSMRENRADRLPMAYFFAVFALLAYRHHFGWPEEHRARAVTDLVVFGR
jgi:hypothetical protein